MSTNSNKFLYLLLLIICAFGYRIFFYKPKYANWPHTTAIIKETVIPKHFKMPSTTKRSSKQYGLYVKYSFSVNDISYDSSDRIEFTDLGKRQLAIEKELEIGNEITISYNPSNPNETVFIFIDPRSRP